MCFIHENISRIQEANEFRYERMDTMESMSNMIERKNILIMGLEDFEIDPE